MRPIPSRLYNWCILNGCKVKRVNTLIFVSHPGFRPKANYQGGRAEIFFGWRDADHIINELKSRYEWLQ